MSLRDYFPATKRTVLVMTAPTVRRICLAILISLFVFSAAMRVYSFVLVHRIQAVISGLSKLRIDETTEEEVIQNVPFLIRSNWDQQVRKSSEVGGIDEGVERVYHAGMSNDSTWMRFASFAWRFPSKVSAKTEPPRNWIFSLADLLGYRYIGFGAGVVLLNGKVSRISYGIANNLVFPRVIGDIVSVQSYHSMWAPRQNGFEVSSSFDESPQFRVDGSDRSLAASYAPEASPDNVAHMFKVDLTCFWGFVGCNHARQVAPLLWQDHEAIGAATLARLQSNDPCPDRILIGRVKYLPDIGLMLLESIGSKSERVNEDGLPVDEIWTRYKLIEVLRGRQTKSWDAVRSVGTIPYPGDYQRKLRNPALEWANAGERVLAFDNLIFDSCRVVLATPSAMAAIQSAIPKPRRSEDELVSIE
jgi:hypothetical protein